MNFIEAIKSGKPLRRTGKSIWIGQNNRTDLFLQNGPTFYNTITGYLDPNFLLNTIRIYKEDILAEDWEVKND